VIAVRELTPRMRRLTVSAPTLRNQYPRPAQDVELLLTDDTGRRVKRRYTIRHSRSALGEFDLDALLHGTAHSPGARWAAEDMRGPSFFVIDEGTFSVRNSHHAPADFAEVTVPAASGGETNEASLIDIVARGKELFTSVGCEACHRVERDSEAVATGPNLYGLFRAAPRAREVVEGGEGHRFQVKANREYLHRSVREPAAQLAVAESGATRGTAYPALMPPFPKEVISDEQIDAIGAYLATLNESRQAGPVIRLGVLKPSAPYDPMADALQWLVNDTVRLQRGPLPGTSARAIHVGNPNGVN